MFEFSDLNMQVMPQDVQGQQQLCINLTGCFCASHPTISLCRLPTRCFCVSNQITCFCFSHPVTYCRCLTQAITIPCICLSKPIASVPPPFKDFTIYEQVKGVTREIADIADLDALKAELQQALKHVEIQREVVQRTTGPQSEAAFDQAETALKQQLDELRKQREEFQKSSGGGTGEKKK
jgi:hypothetical protein